jgi:hypothetical protein
VRTLTCTISFFFDRKIDGLRKAGMPEDLTRGNSAAPSEWSLSRDAMSTVAIRNVRSTSTPAVGFAQAAVLPQRLGERVISHL